MSIIGVYGGLMDKFPMGSLMNRSHHRAHRPVPRAPLHAAAARAHPKGDIDPTFVITHRMPLEQAPEGYETFKHKQDDCVKVVLSA